MEALLSLIDEPRASILRYINECGDATVDEIVDHQQLSATTIRHHLDKLCDADLVSRQRRRNGPGRPRFAYRLSKRAQQLLPSQEGELFPNLIAFLIDEDQSALVDAFFERFWTERRQRLTQQLSTLGDAASLGDQLEVIVTFFDNQGFMPQLQLSADDDTHCVRQCHCPFASTTQLTELPCELEEAMLNDLLDAQIKRTHHMPSGDDTCTYCVTIES